MKINLSSFFLNIEARAISGSYLSRISLQPTCTHRRLRDVQFFLFRESYSTSSYKLQISSTVRQITWSIICGNPENQKVSKHIFKLWKINVLKLLFKKLLYIDKARVNRDRYLQVWMCIKSCGTFKDWEVIFTSFNKSIDS